MANTAGQLHALIDCYGQHRKPVARSNWLLWPTPQASKQWDERWGDRKIEVVFVAARCTDRPNIYRQLTAALLTEEELRYDIQWWNDQPTTPLDAVTASASSIFRHHPGVMQDMKRGFAME